MAGNRPSFSFNVVDQTTVNTLGILGLIILHWTIIKVIYGTFAALFFFWFGYIPID